MFFSTGMVLASVGLLLLGRYADAETSQTTETRSMEPWTDRARRWFKEMF